MFGRLATRLTAAYVFAAILLVVIVVAAVLALALSLFATAAREGEDAVVRQVPDELRLELARRGTLEAAAPELARHLARPGLFIVIARVDHVGRHFLAGSYASGVNGRLTVVTGALAGPPGSPPGPGSPEGRGGLDGRGPPDGESERAPHHEGMSPFPFGLNAVLRLAPRSVTVAGARVTVFPDPAPFARSMNALLVAMVPIGAFVVLAAWLLGRAIAGHALQPLIETTQSLHCFGRGDFAPRPIASSQRNEIGALVDGYNAAVAQVAAAFAERRAVEEHMRQFVADAGHELRTPLTVVMGFLDVLLRRAHQGGVGDAGNAHIYETMLAESRRMRALIDKLIVLARLEHAPVGASDRETVDLAEIAARVATAFELLSPQTPIVVRRAPDALVRGDEVDLHDAVANLVENALKYAPGSPVEIDVERHDATVVLAVADEGPGIAADERERIFDRFYRGRERSTGTDGFGLGLAIARRAVVRAGGELALASELGRGARFTMRIPAAPHGERLPLGV